MIIIGIDPGNSGGIAIMDTKTNEVFVIPMPETDMDIFNAFRNIPVDGLNAKAYLELVHAFPGYKKTNADGSVETKSQGVTSVWTFAENYGKLKMALTAAGIPFELVTPMKWQKRLSIPPRDKSKPHGAHKNVLKQKAQQLFPHTHITLQTADALLIMEYGRREVGYNG